MGLNALLERVDRLKMEIDSLRPIDVDQERRIMQKLRLEWTFHSNSIEGNTLTYGETKAFLLHGITAQGKPFRDYLDIQGHHQAIDYLLDIVRRQEPLVEATIRELHKIILVKPYARDALTHDGRPTKKTIRPGQYKKWPNHVRTSTGEIHYYATPEETPAKMSDLMAWYRRELDKGNLHPLNLAATFHYQFVDIHPFDDGNGRMARLLLNLILMQNGFPPIIIRTDSKENYLLALEQADEDDLEPFITIVGNALLDSMQLYLRGARGESVEEASDIDKKIALLEMKIQAEKTKITKTTDSQLNLFNRALSPFLSHMFTQISKFDRFFYYKIFTTHYDHRHKGRDSWDVERWQSGIDELSNIMKTDSDLRSVGLHCQWISFVTDEDFNLDIDIDILLREYEFEVSCSVAEHKEMLFGGGYDAEFSDEELQKFTLKAVNAVFAPIEQKTGESISGK